MCVFFRQGAETVSSAGLSSRNKYLNGNLDSLFDNHEIKYVNIDRLVETIQTIHKFPTAVAHAHFDNKYIPFYGCYIVFGWVRRCDATVSCVTNRLQKWLNNKIKIKERRSEFSKK